MISGKKSDQTKKFINAAHEVGASEDESAFDRTLSKIAKAPPLDTVKGRKRDRKRSSRS